MSTRLIDLLEASETARRRVDLIGMRNTVGLTMNERVQLDIDYEAALRDWEQKRLAYATAVRAAALDQIDSAAE